MSDWDQALELGAAQLQREDPDHVVVGCLLLGGVAEIADEERQAVIAGRMVHLLDKEADSRVVWATARALGMTGSGVGAAALVRLATYHDHLVRLEVAMGLPRCLSDDPVALGVQALISLTGDPHGEVRDWATFGLGAQLDVDGTAVRDALAGRVDDPSGDTADEAMLGLARRHDPRAYDLVRRRLSGDRAGALAVKAAAYLADPRLIDVLRAWDADDEDIDVAVGACDPDIQQRRLTAHAELLAAVEAALPRRQAALSCTQGELGVTLRIADGSWDADALLARAGSAGAAAACVAEDLQLRPTT
jgi:HEAT repeat protein